jgi:hypothetical protein
VNTESVVPELVELRGIVHRQHGIGTKDAASIIGCHRQRIVGIGGDQVRGPIIVHIRRDYAQGPVAHLTGIGCESGVFRGGRAETGGQKHRRQHHLHENIFSTGRFH